MSDFILRQVVRDVLADTDKADPGEVAGEVDALRVTAKAILRDLWREAKRLHETP